MSPYRPNVDEVLEVNVKLDENLSMNERQRMTKKFRDTLQLNVGITTVGGEVRAPNNIQALIRNSAAINELIDIQKAVGNAFTTQDVNEVNLVSSNRLIVREQERKPFIEPSDKSFNFIIPVADYMLFEDTSMYKLNQQTRKIQKEINSIRINEVSILGTEESKGIEINGIQINTEETNIGLEKAFQISKEIDNIVNIDLDGERTGITTSNFAGGMS